jgi:type VI protein secretion system component Hcp
MRIDGPYETLLPGDTVRAGRQWSEILSFSFDPQAPVSGGWSGASQRQVRIAKSIFIVRTADASSPKLFQKTATGTEIGTVFIDAAEGTGEKELVRARIVLKNVVISDFQYRNFRNQSTEAMTLSFSGAEF